MNVDKFVAIAGNPDVNPSPNPLIILPTKLPIALPTKASVSPPEEISSLNPGILDNAPIAAITPAIIAMNPAKPSAP